MSFHGEGLFVVSKALQATHDPQVMTSHGVFRCSQSVTVVCAHTWWYLNSVKVLARTCIIPQLSSRLQYRVCEVFNAVLMRPLVPL